MVTVDLTGATTIERSAIAYMRALAQAGVVESEKTDDETFLNGELQARIDAYVEAFLTDKLQDLKPLAKQFLNLTDADKQYILDELQRRSGETQGAEVAK